LLAYNVLNQNKMARPLELHPRCEPRGVCRNDVCIACEHDGSLLQAFSVR
jgi:hypothetical protein